MWQLKLEPRPSELIRFLRPHAADRSAPILVRPTEAGVSGRDATGAGEITPSLGGNAVGERAKGARVCRTGDVATGEDVARKESFGSSILVRLPATPSTTLFLLIVAVLQACVTTHALGLVKALPFAIGYLWLYFALAMIMTMISVLVLAEGWWFVNDDEAEADDVSITGAELEVATEEFFQHGNQDQADGRTIGDGGDALRRLESRLALSAEWVWKLIAFEVFYAATLAILFAWGERHNDYSQESFVTAENLSLDGIASSWTMLSVLAMGVVSALGLLVSAVDVVLAALGFAFLPPLAAAISMITSVDSTEETVEPGNGFSPGTKAEYRTLAEGKCDGIRGSTGVVSSSLPRMNTSTASATTGTNAASAGATDSRRDGQRSPPRDDPTAAAVPSSVGSVSLLETALRLVVISGGAATVLGGGWILIRPLLAFSLLNVARLLLFLASSPRSRELRVVRTSVLGSELSHHPAGSRDADSTGVLAEAPRQSAVGGNSSTPQPESGVRRVVTGIREKVGGWYARRLGRRGEQGTRPMPDVRGDSEEKDAPVSFPSRQTTQRPSSRIESSAEAAVRSNAPQEFALASSTVLGSYNVWRPIYVDETQSGVGNCDASEARDAVSGGKPTRRRRARVARVIQAFDGAVASVYAERFTNGTFTDAPHSAENVPDQALSRSREVSRSMLLPCSSQAVPRRAAVYFRSTGDVVLSWTALVAVAMTARREYKAVRAGRSVELLCLFAGKMLVAGEMNMKETRTTRRRRSGCCMKVYS